MFQVLFLRTLRGLLEKEDPPVVLQKWKTRQIIMCLHLSQSICHSKTLCTDLHYTKYLKSSSIYREYLKYSMLKEDQ